MSKTLKNMNGVEVDYSRNYAKKYNADPVNQARRRNLTFVREYGITTLQRDEMFLQQGGRCAVCGRHQSEFKRRLAVDHCHITGKVRGLLCMYCNRYVVAVLTSSSHLLESAKLYLERSA